MSTTSEKLLKIIADIKANGSVSMTRLTVLKKWFERPGRLPTFGLWMATHVASRKGETTGTAGELFDEASALLANYQIGRRGPDRTAARDLYYRLQNFQNEYGRPCWGPVRIIHHWNLFLVEQGLGIYIGHYCSPSTGYKLAANYCQNYDPRYGTDLNGPSRARVNEIIQFVLALEALEQERLGVLPNY
jgi:hypothetical protein